MSVSSGESPRDQEGERKVKENQRSNVKGAVVVQKVPLQAGSEGIALLVRQDLFVELFDGPWPGVILLPTEARKLADLLELVAAEVESGAERPDGLGG
jgi:hypothetical protein